MESVRFEDIKINTLYIDIDNDFSDNYKHTISYVESYDKSTYRVYYMFYDSVNKLYDINYLGLEKSFYNKNEIQYYNYSKENLNQFDSDIRNRLSEIYIKMILKFPNAIIQDRKRKIKELKD
jgi:hypothetical protein